MRGFPEDLILSPMQNYLDYFSCPGTFTLCRTRVKVVSVKTVLQTLIGIGERFRINRSLIKVFKIACFNCHCCSTIIYKMIEKEIAQFQLVKVYLITYDFNRRVT